MIGLVLEDRCTGCGACVEVCPTDVFETAPPAAASRAPAIARQDDCQTCFMCELYCPADAIYVDPDCERPATLDADAVRRDPTLGQFRRHSGWGVWAADGRFPNEHWRMEQMFALARALPPRGA